MKLLLPLLFLLQFAIAQTKIAELPAEYSSTFYSNKESLAISNPKTNELVVYLEDYQKSKAFLLGADFKLKATIEAPALASSFKNFLGYNIKDDGTYEIFFSNNNKKKLGLVHLDFKNAKAVNNELPFKIKKESYVESITFKDTFIYISAVKNSSQVKFYSFKDAENPKVYTADFSFLDRQINGFSKNAYNTLVAKGILSKGSLTKIDDATPNAIENTCEKNKVYQFNDKLYFTFDLDKKKTILAVVDPNDNFKVASKMYSQKKLETASTMLNYNSYIHDNKLFQAVVSPSTMAFKVTDLTTDAMLKEINLNKEDSITFKNTPILQEGPGVFGFQNEREMEKTSKFLRKIAQGDLGLVVYKINLGYEVTIGSRKEVSNGGGMMMGGMGGFAGVPLATMGPVSVTFNPTYVAYGGYTSTKSVRIECLFDDNFKHIEGNIPSNIFDDIFDFEDRFEDREPVSIEQSLSGKYTYEKYEALKLKNIFWHKNQLVYGFLAHKNKNYHLIAF